MSEPKTNLDFLEVMADARDLCHKIKNSGFIPELIVGVTRGGWIPARIVSGIIGTKRMTSIGLSYTDKERTKLETYQTPNPMPKKIKVLIIEDCLESGYSLNLAQKFFLEQENIVKTAALYITEFTKFKPDFFAKKYDAPPSFPWE